MDEVFNQREIEEAERFAEILDTLEAGGQPDVDALVDAELASLLRTADAVRQRGLLATETPAFESYRARSRAYVLHSIEHGIGIGIEPSIEQQRRSPAAARPIEAQPFDIIRSGVIPFVARHRRWTVFAPVAAAAAAAGLMLFTPFAAAPGDDRPAAATNLTVAQNEAELARINQALATLTQRSTRGEAVDASILRTITENTTAVANRIETQPQSVSKEHVENYQRAVAQSSTALGAVLPTVSTQDALAAAQRATEDGKVTAARFLGADAGPTATSSPTATPAPAVSPSPLPPPAAGSAGTTRP